MINFAELFESAVRVRNLETKAEFMAVQMQMSFESPCPDQFTESPVQHRVEKTEIVFDKVEQKMIEKTVETTAPGVTRTYDPAAGDFHGGNVRGRKGDWILFDGTTYFVVRGKDDSGVPVFDKKFLKL